MHDEVTSLADLDLFAPEFVANPHPVLRQLRERAPVHYDSSTGLWLISRYDDVRRMLTDPHTFRPDNALTAITPVSPAALRVLARAGFSLPPTLANNGTPSHTGLRRLVAQFLTRTRVASVVPLIERLAHESLHHAESALNTHGFYDLAELARDLPCQVLLHLLGIGDADIAALKRWSSASLELFWGRPAPGRQHHLAQLAGEFHEWLRERITTAQPQRDNIFGALATYHADVTTNEAIAVCYFLLIAGQETTSQLLTTAFHRLVSRPTLWRQLASTDQTAQAWVEEILRREPPVTTWRRITSTPTQLSGVRIPAKAHLLLMLAGTGSDPHAFDRPEQWCPHRADARRHLAFGHGTHYCLGAELARTEAATVLRVTAQRLPHIELAESHNPPMLGLLSFRAPQRVLVRRREFSRNSPNDARTTTAAAE